MCNTKADYFMLQSSVVKMKKRGKKVKVKEKEGKRSGRLEFDVQNVHDCLQQSPSSKK